VKPGLCAQTLSPAALTMAALSMWPLPTKLLDVSMQSERISAGEVQPCVNICYSGRRQSCGICTLCGMDAHLAKTS
jgi:hypothetical protein